MLKPTPQSHDSDKEGCLVVTLEAGSTVSPQEALPTELGWLLGLGSRAASFLYRPGWFWGAPGAGLLTSDQALSVGRHSRGGKFGGVRSG